MNHNLEYIQFKKYIYLYLPHNIQKKGDFYFKNISLYRQKTILKWYKKSQVPIKKYGFRVYLKFLKIRFKITPILK